MAPAHLRAISHPPSTTSPAPDVRRRALIGVLAAATLVTAPAALAAGGEDPKTVASGAGSPSSTDGVRFEGLANGDAVLFTPQRAERPTTTTTQAPTTTTTAPPPPPPPPPPAAPTTAAPAPAPQPESGYGDPNDPATWDRLAQCESGGNWAANTGNGYYGGLQFSLSSWRAVGGTGYPHEHSRETQIEMGKRLQRAQGWDAWPACSSELGYG